MPDMTIYTPCGKCYRRRSILRDVRERSALWVYATVAVEKWAD